MRSQPHRTRPIRPHTLETARHHGLESDHQHHIDDAAAHQRPGELQPRTACCARVGGVVHGNTGHAELVEDALAAARVAVAVACHAGLDVVVGQVGVEERFGAGFEAEFGVRAETAWFDEFRQADAQDVGVVGRRHLFLGKQVDNLGPLWNRRLQWECKGVTWMDVDRYQGEFGSPLCDMGTGAS